MQPNLHLSAGWVAIESWQNRRSIEAVREAFQIVRNGAADLSFDTAAWFAYQAPTVLL